MALKVKKGLLVLKDTIRNGKTHRDYKRVCELAEEYTAYVTGEEIEKLLVQFTPRESDEEFAQRVALTQAITPYMASRIMTPMYKAGRTLASKTIEWADSKNAEEKKKKLYEAISHYYGQMSVDDYLSYRMVELDCTDPNTFIVTDFEGEVKPEDANSVADPYPFEVNAKEAIDFKYKNNILQYLTVLNEIKDLKKYTIYCEDGAIVAQQILEDDLDAYLKLNPKALVFYKDEEKGKADEIYILTEIPLKPGKVPAIRVGTKKDLKTRGRTCVPMMHQARSFFKKSLKLISELDLTITLHTFPQKISYDSVCPGDPKNNVICIDGKTPQGGICKICNGSGFNEHKSAQNILRVKMPDKISDIVSLENFLTYKYPPIDIIKFMKDFGMYELCELAIMSVYNSETFTTDTVAKTATEMNLDFESVYDALKPFTDQYSTAYKNIVTLIAAYLSSSEGLIVEHKFPKDFKMKPVGILLDELAKANTSGSPSYIKKELNHDIAQKLYIDKPEELLKIDVKEKFFPFNGKSETEIGTIIMNNLVTMFNKVLYANFDLIFDELDQENTTDTVSFYKMDVNEQRKLLKKKVEDYIVLINVEQAASRSMDFGNTGDASAGNGDTQDYDIGDSVTYNGEPVEILTANPGPSGGIYSIKLTDGTEKTITGDEFD